ncbi:MAG: hypothetical protein IT361_11850 [Gemmatimonadaceae bacterium]|nr:hypothetical protein [Gemmatimonadaceae bacterium]
MSDTANPADRALVAFFRKALIAVFLFGAIGTAIELVLLEHVDGWRQWVPIVLLGVGALLGAGAAWRPGPVLLRSFNVFLTFYIVAGAIGTWFHYQGNVEWELERTPELAGLALFKAAMEGATPALAPGTMIQLGLIGLLFTWRHPNASAERSRPHPPKGA